MGNQQLNKREEYISKKKQREDERFRQVRSKKIRKMAFILMPLLLIAGGAVFGITKFAPESNRAGTPKIEINPKEYDAGQVSMAAGLVEKTFEIKNVGDGDLKIDNVVTSCHCTIAKLKVGDKESPEFGMVNDNPFWSQKILPGEAGYLEVVFDPAFHGTDAVGFVVRAVYLSTNDPQNRKAEVRLAADVIH